MAFSVTSSSLCFHAGTYCTIGTYLCEKQHYMELYLCTYSRTDNKVDFDVGLLTPHNMKFTQSDLLKEIILPICCLAESFRGYLICSQLALDQVWAPRCRLLAVAIHDGKASHQTQWHCVISTPFVSPWSCQTCMLLTCDLWSLRVAACHNTTPGRAEWIYFKSYVSSHNGEPGIVVCL